MDYVSVLSNMANFTTLLFTYVLGGITFIPLAIVLFFAHAYFGLPEVEAPQNLHSQDGQKEQDKELEEKFSSQANEPEVTSGYFAVCREFVPGGVNGKPPERTSPSTRDTMTADSPSVYQTMYRNIFERRKAQAPSLDPSKGQRKAQNVFFVALR